MGQTGTRRARTYRRAVLRTRRRLAAACLAGLLAIGVAASASASSGEPPTGQPEAGNLGGSDTSQPSATNTDYTPRAQPGEQAGWTKIAGADFGSQTAPASSPTPFDTDFYSVSFQDEQNGLAAGSQCRRDPKTPDKQITGDATQTCERVPVIYRYTAPKESSPTGTPSTSAITPKTKAASSARSPGSAPARPSPSAARASTRAGRPSRSTQPPPAPALPMPPSRSTSTPPRLQNCVLDIRRATRCRRQGKSLAL